MQFIPKDLSFQKAGRQGPRTALATEMRLIWSSPLSPARCCDTLVHRMGRNNGQPSPCPLALCLAQGEKDLSENVL